MCRASRYGLCYTNQSINKKIAYLYNMKDYMKSIPELAPSVKSKKRKPKLMAVVDEDNCTGCQVCVPFCPVDCIEPVPKEKYDIPIPPVQVRFNECIGCQMCAKACSKLTWDAIRMMKTSDFEEKYDIEIS